MPRSRKWLITINNPIVHDFDHARIKASVLDLPSVVYWCMAYTHTSAQKPPGDHFAILRRSPRITSTTTPPQKAHK